MKSSYNVDYENVKMMQSIIPIPTSEIIWWLIYSTAAFVGWNLDDIINNLKKVTKKCHTLITRNKMDESENFTAKEWKIVAALLIILGFILTVIFTSQ